MRRQPPCGAEAPLGYTAHFTSVSGPHLRPKACTAPYAVSRFQHIESNLERALRTSCKIRWKLPGFANSCHRQLEILCVSQGVKVSGGKTRSRNTVHCNHSGAGLRAQTHASSRDTAQRVRALSTQRDDVNSNPQNPHTGSSPMLQVPVTPALWRTEAGGSLGLLAASST